MHDRFSSLNFKIYNSARGVALYRKAASLQPSETVLYDELREALPRMDMLDVGVGAGRTTAFFAPYVKSYLGIDFAPEMVEACKERFPGFRFAVADATNLQGLSDSSFDIILFSYNGLDCMTQDNRLVALSEFWRLMRPGGTLIFSSHNLNFLPDMTRGFRPEFSANPIKLLRSLKRFARFILINRHVTYADDMKTALVFERHLGFEFPLLFVRPEHQVGELRRAGWTLVQAFASDTGQCLGDSQALAKVDSPWVYYSCRKPE